jgi:hypothetical protein
MLHTATLASSGIRSHTNLESDDGNNVITLMLRMLNQMCEIVESDQFGHQFNPHERSIRVLSSMLI